MSEPQIFRASELLDMAVAIERSGEAFYQASADAANDDRLKKFFGFMVDQERKHSELFLNMKEGHEDYDLPESYPGEARSFVQSFVRDEVFATPEEAGRRTREINDPFDAVDMALQFERESIAFYSGMKQLVRRSDHEIIERVIEEEHDHIRRLLDVRRSLEA